MPYILINEVNYYYEETGSGDETIIFSHGLLWSGHMFHKQVNYFKDKYRIITYDHRGQGKTEATADGYDMDNLYEDAVVLIEKLEGKPVIFAGLSMGGFVGMRLAARKPELIKKLILMVGDQDVATKPEKARKIHSLIKNSKLVIFEGGGHTSSVEEPEIYNREIEKFLNT